MFQIVRQTEVDETTKITGISRIESMKSMLGKGAREYE